MYIAVAAPILSVGFPGISDILARMARRAAFQAVLSRACRLGDRSAGRALASGVAELVRIIEVEVTKDRRTVASFEPKVKAEVKPARVVCPIWGVAMAA